MLQIELTEGDCVNGSAGCKMGEAVAGSLGPGEERCEACPPALPCSPSGRHVQVSHRPCCPRVSRQEWSPEGAGPRARCVPLGPPRVLPLRGAPPGRLTRRPDTCSPLAARLAPVRKRGQGETEAGSRRPECGGRPGRGTKEPRVQTRAPSARPPRASPRGSSERHSRLLSEEGRAYRA